MSYILLRGCWCDHCSECSAPTEDKIDDMKHSFYEELECVFDKLPKHHMKMLGYFNAKADRKDIFKPTIRNEFT
jgi:hypothetical protein